MEAEMQGTNEFPHSWQMQRSYVISLRDSFCVQGHNKLDTCI